MSGIGEDHHPEEWAALRDAAQAYGVAVYGPDYMCHEFVFTGFMVTMAEENEVSEYVMATSSSALHVNEGLMRRGLSMLLFPQEDGEE